MKRYYILTAISLIISVNLSAQFEDLSQPIPFDPEVRTGVLENGLTYYIRHNEQPRERASFYIIQNVGAILEEEDQNGLAHFLEHMAFNGTQHFPGKSMLNTLEHHGIKFGRDINAYTSTDETVYNISNVPVTDNLLDTCLLILNDWSNYLLLTEEEIDAERGVISEEWRTRRDAGFRIRAQIAPLLYNHSKYAKRDVIGDLNVIQNFDPETLRAFYHDWYRTDLQAIAIVGDVDVDEVEKKIEALFSKIPPVEHPKERLYVEIEDNPAPNFVLATDKELQKSNISLLIRHKKEEKPNLAKLRDKYIRSAFNQLMSARIAELVQNGDAPFLNGTVQVSGFKHGYDLFNISATANEGEEAEALLGVLVELERVLRHGFTNSELERVKTNMQVGAEMKYKKRGQISNDAFCKSLKSVYLDQEVLLGSEFVYEFSQYAIPSLTLEEVSSQAGKWYAEMNQTIIITGPEKEGIHIDRQKVSALFDEVKNLEIDPYKDEFTGTDLLNGTISAGGEVVEERRLEEFDAVEWKLSNGATVIHRFADFEKESIALYAFSYGGSSLYEDVDVPSVSVVGSFVGSYGIGEYDMTSYRKVMTGSTARCNFGIGSYTETLNGTSSPKDFEEMLQLAYMRFEMPRFDMDVFENLMERNYESVKNRSVNPSTIMRDTLNHILTDGHPRVRRFDSIFLSDVDFHRIEEIYRDRITDASDFTFIIVGDIPEETAKPLVAKYIGGIKDIDRQESWKDRQVNFPEGRQKREIAIPMTEAKSTVVIKMQMDAPYTRENIIHQSILASILRLRYTEEIREKEGGTYGVSVKAGSSRLPKGKLSLSIQFDCDPDKAEYLTSLVYKELEHIKTHVNDDDLNKVVRNLRKNSEQSKPHNSYWMNALNAYYMTGMNALEPAYFDDIVNNVTVQDIQDAAKWFLEHSDEVQVIFYPEKANNS